MRYLSVASGIEGATVAWGPLGWEPVAFAEINPAATAILTRHYPKVPNFGDMTRLFTPALGPVDLLVGGTPCQAFSVAGVRRGLDDARGNLALAFVELAHELARKNGLRNCLWENVPGVLSMRDNAFGCFLGGLVGGDAIVLPGGGRWPDQGMASGPRGRLCWRVLDAQHFGLAQRRRRLFVVVDFGGGADPAAVLFERAGLHKHPAQAQDAPFPAVPGANTPGAQDGEQPFTLAIRGRKDGAQIEWRQDGLANVLLTPSGGRAGIGVGAICVDDTLRRFTPTEAERLMGFPDGYTGGQADSDRYRQLGNSFPIPVLRWIGRRFENNFEKMQKGV
jgi:site-specific DNA-cytosine methylase